MEASSAGADEASRCVRTVGVSTASTVVDFTLVDICIHAGKYYTVIPNKIVRSSSVTMRCFLQLCKLLWLFTWISSNPYKLFA